MKSFPLAVTEVPSSSATLAPKNDLFSKFMEIKSKNVELKKIAFNELWKQGPSTSTRLLTTMDFGKKQLQLAVLELKTQNVKTPYDYKASRLTVNLEQIHPMD